jgi:hypothetical protein
MIFVGVGYQAYLLKTRSLFKYFNNFPHTYKEISDQSWDNKG